MPKSRVLIVDWGNTLCASSEGYSKIAHEAAAIFTDNGIPMSAEEYRAASKAAREELRREMAGDTGRHRLGAHDRRIAEKFGKRIGWRLAEKIDRQVFAVYLSKYRARKGAERFLATARKNGARMILVSNSSYYKLRKEVGKLGFGKYFDCVICSGKCGYEKSSGVPYKMAMKRAIAREWANRASDFLVVGDREEEDGAARKLGMEVAILGDEPGAFEKVLKKIRAGWPRILPAPRQAREGRFCGER